MKKICFLFLFALTAIQTLAQNAGDTTNRQFHDDLLDHLVGKWKITSNAHGSPFTSVLDAKWVLNHQYLHVHLKSNEIIPWWHVQMEYDEYVGDNHLTKRYVIHTMSIEGDEDLSEGFCYGYRTGNEFKAVAKFGTDSLVVQRFTWEPVSRSWHVESRWVIAGKEGEVFLEMKLVATKPPAKKKKSLNK
jgi:hypothetical protein